MTPADANHDVTLGELARSIASLEGRIDKQFGAVHHRLDNLTFVPREVYEVERKQLLARIVELEEAKKWTNRTIVVSLLLPCLVALVVALVVAR